MNFSAIVRDYTARHRERARREVRYFMIQRSLEVREATLSRLPSGKRHPHQRRIPLRVLQTAERRLQAVAGQLQAAKSFAELHRLIEAKLSRFAALATWRSTTSRIAAALTCDASPRRSIFTRARVKGRALQLTCASFRQVYGNCRRRKSKIACAFIGRHCAAEISASARARCASASYRGGSWRPAA